MYIRERARKQKMYGSMVCLQDGHERNEIMLIPLGHIKKINCVSHINLLSIKGKPGYSATTCYTSRELLKNVTLDTHTHTHIKFIKYYWSHINKFIGTLLNNMRHLG